MNDIDKESFLSMSNTLFFLSDQKIANSYNNPYKTDYQIKLLTHIMIIFR